MKMYLIKCAWLGWKWSNLGSGYVKHISQLVK